MSTAKPRGVLVGRTNTRDVLFKLRLRYAYGCDPEYYDEVLAYKGRFELCIAIPPVAAVEKFLSPEPLPDADFFPDSEFTEGVRDQLLAEWPLLFTAERDDNTAKVDLTNGDLALMDVFGRVGAIADVGGSIVALRWLPTLEPAEYEYVALSVVHAPIAESLNHERLGLFNQEMDDSLATLIQVWRYRDGELTRHLLIDTTGVVGVTNYLEWLPLSVPGCLGVVCGCFNDGNWHAIKISRDYGQVSLTKLLMTITVPDTTITSFSFRNSSHVIVGTATGHIAQFEVPAPVDSDGVTEPQWMVHLFKTAIDSLLVNASEPGKDVVVANSLGLTMCAVELDNYVVGQLTAFAPKTWLRPLYNPKLRLYLVALALDTLSYMFLRAPTELINLLVRPAADITTFSALERLGHPLAIVGTLAGDFFVVNYVRKFLNGVKLSNKVIVPIQLWKVTYINRELKINGDFFQLPNEANNQCLVTPAEISFTASGWNENPATAHIYAAGNVAGLLFVELLAQ